MTKANSDDSQQKPATLRWSWFLTGCGCFLVGWLYLGFAELGGITTAEEDAPEQTSLTSKGSLPAVTE